MFKELRNSIRDLLLTAEYEYKLADNVNKILDKLETRYKNYEKVLKEYADPNNWGYNNEFEYGYYPAKEVLKTEEELEQEQVDKLLHLFKEVDKEIIIKATEVYLSKLND